MLSDQFLSVCLSVCPVCVIRALWPNGWMDQDGTWDVGRPQPRQLCVRWVPSSLPERRRSCFPTRRCVRWDSAPPPLKGHSPPPIFGQYPLWPNS